MADDVEKAAENTAGKAVGAIETVTEKAKELASNAGEFVGHAKEKVQEWASTAKDKAKDAAHAAGDYVMHAKDKVQELASNAAQGAGEAIQTAGDELTRVVRRYPMQSLLAGLALGYLLGRATSRS
jgi:ElaB/YqjD/DUF883 family membrane-anchored ribosome-binding protein